ncbi:MAG: pyruvate kinase, partial [Clostridia bacterium]|nr:pyruvate kinase [Clostridia bacterium]
ERVKHVRKKLGVPIAILLDTKGPEYRIGVFENQKVMLADGDEFVFTTEECVGNEKRVSVSYKNLPHELSVGDTILLNNGLLEFQVTATTETEIAAKVVIGGELSDRKSMSFPGKTLKQEYLSEKDKEDILFGIQNDVDFIACSFVSVKEDVLAIREFVNANGGEKIDLIAKIENRSGVDNIEDIIEVSDGIMVARGDMGVEIPFEQLPAIQKHMITVCRYRGKRVITATEMLESMVTKPRPTRAEISDVANAVYDGTSAVMLSGETAAGLYPVEAVRAMAKIVEQTEKDIDYVKRFRTSEFKIANTTDAISHATCDLSIDLDAKLIIVCTRSGKTARMVSRFRSPKTIIGLTTDEKAWRQLSLSWAVLPVMSEEFQSTDVLFYHATRVAKETGLAGAGDAVVITGGITNGNSGNTSLIKYEILR